MWRQFIPAAVAMWVAVGWGSPAEAQTRRTPTAQRTPAAQGTLGNAGASVGTGITDRVRGFSAGVPTLQEAQQLRDTATRGEFVGAEAQTMPQVGAPQAPATPQRGGRANLRIDPLRQPGRQPGQMQPFGRQGGQLQPYGRQSGSVLQPTLRLGFAAPSASAADVQSAVAAAITRVPSIQENSSIRVRVDGGVVVLEGTVGSAHQRALASQLVALEPGVTRVDNRLTVAPAGQSVP